LKTQFIAKILVMQKAGWVIFRTYTRSRPRTVECPRRSSRPKTCPQGHHHWLRGQTTLSTHPSRCGRVKTCSSDNRCLHSRTIWRLQLTIFDHLILGKHFMFQLPPASARTGPETIAADL